MEIAPADAEEKKLLSERDARVAQAFAEQGNASRAMKLQQRVQNRNVQLQQRTAYLNRNVPQSSGPQQYKSRVDWRRGESETSSYEPVSVTQSGSQYVVERRGLLTDQDDRGYRQQPYLQERLVLNTNGDVVTREVYDTYTTKGGRDRAYLSLRETPTEIYEERRNREGEKLRETRTNKLTGEVNQERYDLYAERQQRQQEQQQLKDLGLSQKEIDALSPGQQRALLDPANAQRYTSTPVPAEIKAKVQPRINAVADEKGNVFERGGGTAEKPGQFIGVRAVTPAEQQAKEQARRQAEKQQRMEAMRQKSGISVTRQGQLRAGQTIIIKEGKNGGQSVPQTFKELGAPEKRLIGQIDFGRQPDATIPERVKKAFGLNVQERPDEISRTSKIYETTITVPNEATARFAGLQGPGKYVMLSEEREDFERKGFIELNTPKSISSAIEKGRAKLTAIDAAGVRAADSARSRSVTQSFAGGPGERLRAAAKDMGGRVVMRVQDTGAFIEKVGAGLANKSEKLEAAYPLVTEADRKGNREQAPLQQVTGGVKLLKRDVLSRVAKGGQGIGGFVEEEGKTLQRSPITAGTGEALILGVGVGAVGKAGRVVKSAGYVQRGEKTVKRAGVAAKIARGTGGTITTVERGAGYALGAAFVVQTGAEIIKAENSREAGAIIARAGNQAVAFGVGYKGGVKLMEVGSRAFKGNTVRVIDTMPRVRIKREVKPLTTQGPSPQAVVNQGTSPLNLDVVNLQNPAARVAAAMELGSRRVSSGRSEYMPPEERTMKVTYTEQYPGLRRFISKPRLVEIAEGKGGRQVMRVREGKKLTRTVQVPGEKKAMVTVFKKGRRVSSAAADRFEFPEITAQEALTRPLKARVEQLAPNVVEQTIMGKEAYAARLRLNGKTYQGTVVENVQLASMSAASDASVRRFGQLLGKKESGRLRVQRTIVQRGKAQTTISVGDEASMLKNEYSVSRNKDLANPAASVDDAGRVTSQVTREGATASRKVVSVLQSKQVATGYFTEVTGETPAPKAMVGRAPKETKRMSISQERRNTIARKQNAQLIKDLAGKREKYLIESRQEAAAQELKVQEAQLDRLVNAEGKKIAQAAPRTESPPASKPLGVRTQGREKNTLRDRLNEAKQQNRARKMIEKSGRDAETRSLGRAIPGLRDVTSTKSKLTSITRQGQSNRQRDRIDVRTAAVTATGLRTESLLDVQREVKTRTPVTTAASRLRERLRSTTKTPEKIETILPKPGRLNLKSEGRALQGYRLLIKRGGRFSEVRSGVFTKNRALQMGAQITDASAAQTFRILKTNERVTDDGGAAGSIIDAKLRKFNRTKIGDYRERQKSLIDSGGELSEITFKGVTASARKRRGL